MTRYPPGLISALEKLRDDSTVVHATSHPPTSHLWIEEPAAQTPQEGRMAPHQPALRHPPADR